MAADVSKNIFKLNILNRVFSLTQPYKKKFYFSIVLSVFLAILSPIRPLLIQFTINKGIIGTQAAWLIKGPGAFLIEITIIQIVLLLVETIARLLFTFTSASLGQSVVRDLRNQTYSKIIHLNLSQFDKTPIGTLTTRTINDIESVNDIFSDGLIPIITDFLSIVSVLIYMFYADWRITLICLIPFPLLIIATFIFKESVKKSFTKVRNAVAALNAFVQEHISGMSVIQIFAAEKREAEKFQSINKEHRNANIKAIFAYSVFFPIVELVSAASIGLLVWWAAQRSFSMPANEAGHLAGVITSFILCLGLLFRPLRIIADKFNVLQMGMIASERVFKILDINEPTPFDARHHKEINALQGTIEYKNVSFSYEESQPVLKNISFKVPAGKTLAIVGNTGSGKSTITSLLNRLYPISNGEILIDGCSIEEIEITFLRSQIAVVLQDVFLFTGTVMDNITLRNPAIQKEEVINAAKMIGIHDFVMQLPGDYNFNILERGAALSVGQRQLLSFARALLYNPSILILDEATSSIDSESEVLIQKAINKLIAGRTCIVIAHRLSTIRKADNILVLERGEMAEMGNHGELMVKKGRYFELLNKQFSGE